MPANPLLDIRFAIPFDQIKPEHVEPAITQLIAETEAGLQKILGVQGPRSYANTLGALDTLDQGLSYAFRLVGHLEAVCTTPELRSAYNAILPTVSAFSSKLQVHEGLYRAVKEFAATPEASQLSPTKKRFLDLTLERFRREGAELSAQEKARLEALDIRLSELTNRFGQNTLDSINLFEIYLQEDQLAGLPESAIAAARQSAEAKGQPGYRFSLQMPSYVAVITYLDDRELRRQFYLAFNNRGTQAEYDNRPLMAEILKLRQEKAELLGYDNFADYILADRMAKNGATAFGFERKLTQEYQPFFEREVAALKAWVQQEYPSAAALEPWDLTYYVEKRRKALYDFDDETLRPYYPLPQVMEGMFELAQRLFGIRIEKIQGLPVWHPQVEVYNLFGPQGDLLARFYTDFFPRESKEGGAWMNFFITGNRDGSSEPHLGTMIANLTPPIGDEPALLLHGEVETIFHEFGHLLHHLLSSVEVRSLAGVNVALDFVELPSQIMENWCWERESLNLYARHHQSGQIIPDDLFQRMTGARSYWAANRTMRQLSFGTLDLSIHTQYGPHQGDLVEYSRQVMQGFISTPLPPDFAFVASFTHLFGAPVGYGASYYSYLWSEVLEADAFSRFKQEGIFNAHTGADFAQHILSKGNSVDPAELFRRFMGRDPKPEALLRRSGLLD